MAEKNNVLVSGCMELGIQLTDNQIDQFETYYELLVEWNKVMNLTGITEYDEVMQKHFVDSLSIVRAADMGQCKKSWIWAQERGFRAFQLR